MDAMAAADECRARRTAKPCGPDAPTLASSLQLMNCRRRWLPSPAHRGERGISRNTIAQGMPDVLAEPVVTAACFPCCRRAMGAASARHSLRPPYFGATFHVSLG